MMKKWDPETSKNAETTSDWGVLGAANDWMKHPNMVKPVVERKLDETTTKHWDVLHSWAYLTSATTSTKKEIIFLLFRGVA